MAQYRIGRTGAGTEILTDPEKVLETVLKMGDPVAVWKHEPGSWSLVLDRTMVGPDHLPLEIHARNVLQGPFYVWFDEGMCQDKYVNLLDARARRDELNRQDPELAAYVADASNKHVVQ